MLTWIARGFLTGLQKRTQMKNYLVLLQLVTYSATIWMTITQLLLKSWVIHQYASFKSSCTVENI